MMKKLILPVDLGLAVSDVADAYYGKYRLLWRSPLRCFSVTAVVRQWQ